MSSHNVWMANEIERVVSGSKKVSEARIKLYGLEGDVEDILQRVAFYVVHEIQDITTESELEKNLARDFAAFLGGIPTHNGLLCVRHLGAEAGRRSVDLRSFSKSLSQDKNYIAFHIRAHEGGY